MAPPDTDTLEDDPFGEAIDRAETLQREYAEQLGLRSDRIPFTAETVPDASVAVRVNDELLEEVATHILNRAGHVSVIDERGAGKSHFRDLVYRSLSSGPRSDEFRIVRIREVESITTRRFYTRLLDGLQRYDDLADVIPDEYPHPTDEVRALVEEVATVLEEDGKACIVQVDQLEDAARNTRTFRQLLAGLQSIGDLGEGEPVFICFLFGTPEVSDRITQLRETFASRLIAADRRLTRFDVAETAELVARWLAWARGESYTEGYATDPYSGGALSAITDRSDGTPRRVRQECYHAFRAGARQFDETTQVEITRETVEEYLGDSE
jgi:type II secretory pathway predicted ATPase ExeA